MRSGMVRRDRVWDGSRLSIGKYGKVLSSEEGKRWIGLLRRDEVKNWA